MFEEALEPGVALRAPELPETQGVKELTALAQARHASYGALSVSIGETDVRIDKDAHERPSALALPSAGMTDGELRRDKRVVRFTLTERGMEVARPLHRGRAEDARAAEARP
jgi:hypothetical protein